MKKTLCLLITIFLFTVDLSAQYDNYQNAFGIRQEGISFYNAEGYNIFHQELQGELDEKGIKKIAKTYKLPKDFNVEEDTNFPGVKIITANYPIDKTDTSEANNFKLIYYLTAPRDGKVKVLGFTTNTERDREIEKQYYYGIIRGLPKEVFTKMQIDTIKFAGREIVLGPVCKWMEARSIQCPSMGQINWSEFTSKVRAEQMIKCQILNNEMKNISQILEESQVNIIFEGTPIVATRKIMKFKVPKMVMGTSNIIIVYYVVAEVRGRYVACVLSHYSNDISDHRLPPLLREVMKLDK